LACNECASRAWCRGEHCGFALSYADKTRIEGVLVRDQVLLGNLSWMATFGAITHADRLCVRGVDGMLGLARPGTSSRPLNVLPQCSRPAAAAAAFSDAVDRMLGLGLWGVSCVHAVCAPVRGASAGISDATVPNHGQHIRSSISCQGKHLDRAVRSSMLQLSDGIRLNTIALRCM